MTVHARVRLRPSVALVPFHEPDVVVCDFFLGNTRRTRRFAFGRDLYGAIRRLDGKHTIAAVAQEVGTSPDQLLAVTLALQEACIVEPMEVSEKIDPLPHRRVVRFLQDFFPGEEVLAAMHTLETSRFVVIGLGGVGSWVAHLLARHAIGEIVLVDDDLVEASNLNRSLFSQAQVGFPKAEAVATSLSGITGRETAVAFRRRITSVQDVAALLDDLPTNKGPTVVVNCADHPSVDDTAAYVGRACLARRLPHVIAGGYNLHLSLVGPTVLPFETACVECMRLGLEDLRPGGHDSVRKLARRTRKIGSIGPLVAISATYAANEAIRAALAGPRLRPAMVNRRAEVNFATGEMTSVALPRRPECSWCGNHAGGSSD